MKTNKKILHALKKSKTENSSIFNDKLWYYFFISNDNWNRIENYYDGDQSKISQCISEVRKGLFKQETAPCITAETTNHRSILKDYYERNEPVFWVATAGDVSLPKGRQAGNLLLYHLSIEKMNSEPNLISIGYDIQFPNVHAIDHHAWLRVSDIKYFGDEDHLDIAYGDVIYGTSLVKKYIDKNGNDSFTLGTTIIRKCGFIKGEEMTVGNDGYDPHYLASRNATVQSYDHGGSQMLRLEYTKKAKQKLRQMKSHEINDIAKEKYYLTTVYKKSHTYNYHDLMKNEKVTELRTTLKNKLKENKSYNIKSHNSPLVFRFLSCED